MSYRKMEGLYTRELEDELDDHLDWEHRELLPPAGVAHPGVADRPVEAYAQQFRITSLDQANWAVRKIARARDRLAEVNALAAREMERIARWHQEMQESIEREIAFFTYLLRQYHETVLAEDPRAKTVKLPAGKLRFQKLPPEIQRDENALLPWVKIRRPDCVVVEERTDWASLKKTLLITDSAAIDPETGEVVPGVKVQPRAPKFTVVTEGGEET